MHSIDNIHIGVIGLGYVGLPLAVEFGIKTKTLGFDINQQRIEELINGKDRTLEVDSEELVATSHLSFSSNMDDLRDCNFFIVTVPTPIDEHKQPDLTPLIKASTTLGKVISKEPIIVFESTVYPGATEEVCVPILEKESGLTFNKDFYVGYSPERITLVTKNIDYLPSRKLPLDRRQKSLIL